MPFPEFESGNKRVLFFTRGRGRGHAVPDIAVVHALKCLRSDVDVRFVSYGTGADTFHKSGIPFIDLGLTDHGGVVDTSVLAGKLIRWLDPHVVISHEEFPAMPAAKIFDKPTLMITDWFLESEGYATNSLKFADRVLFTGAPQVFAEPSSVRGKVEYLGPLLRDFKYAPADSMRAREELGIPAEAKVISVFPGSWREAGTPLLPAVLPAFDKFPGQRCLIWLAGPDHQVVQAAAEGRPDVMVLEWSSQIDQLMVASDVAITKANRKTVFELLHLGVPTIAVSFGLNAGDDIAIAGRSDVSRLSGRNLSSSALASAIASIQGRRAVASRDRFCTAKECAERIDTFLQRS